MAESKTPVIIEAIGWTAGVYGACIAMPQIVRVLRTRTTAGIPLLAWQSSMASNLSWTAYGVITGHANLWLPSLLLTASAAWMLIMISRDLRDSGSRSELWQAYGLPIVVAAMTITVALAVGPLAFSAAVFVPAAVSQLMQLRSLLTAPDISAVSGTFLAMGVLCQVLWFSWGVLAHDLSNELVAGSLILLSGSNLACYLLRWFDLLRPQRAESLTTPDHADNLTAEYAVVRVRTDD